MAFLLGWEIGFFFDARGFFSRVSAGKKIGVFLVFFLVFLVFFGGACVLFGVFFVFRALAGGKLFFFRRWHEQNREFPLWVQPDSK